MSGITDPVNHAVEHERITNRIDALESGLKEVNVRVDQSTEANSKLEGSMQEVMVAVRDLTSQVSDLVAVVRPVLEDWRTKSYGMKWFKSITDNSKLWVCIGVGAFAFVKFDVVLPMVMKAVGH